MNRRKIPKGTKTYENLKAGFQGESMANRRYLYYARLARERGLEELAEVFEKTAQPRPGTPSHIDAPGGRPGRRD